eukprot:scaffold4218_cov99-Isochrysis_galbana.AAC.2
MTRRDTGDGARKHRSGRLTEFEPHAALLAVRCPSEWALPKTKSGWSVLPPTRACLLPEGRSIACRLQQNGLQVARLGAGCAGWWWRRRGGWRRQRAAICLLVPELKRPGLQGRARALQLAEAREAVRRLGRGSREEL